MTSHSHPGCSMVPAALAAGEEFGIDGTAAASRRDARLRHRPARGHGDGRRQAFSYESSLATHSIAGTFGAAAAARLRRRSRCAPDALGARLYRAAIFGDPLPGGATPITSRRPSCSPACRRATASPRRFWSNRAGTASTDIFSGADNFFAAYAPKAQPARLIEKLGERYEITQTDIKKWTVGSPIQGPLDAIETIRNKKPVRGRTR